MKLCVALDGDNLSNNISLADELKDFDIWIKVGFRSFLQGGAKLIEELKKNNRHKIFLDLKLYDIPNTMAEAAEEIVKMGVDMFNIHASAGDYAMRTVMQRIEKFSNRPLVLAVTALTSFSNEDFKKIYNANIKESADIFGKLSFDAGLDGVVCSVFESLSVKKHTSNDFLTLTPGIRTEGGTKDDQQRVATPQIAKKNLVDFIVVGRPIYKSNNPQRATQAILQNI